MQKYGRTMSRVGKLPIKLPEGVQVTVSGRELTVSGPNGKITRKLPRGIEVSQKEQAVIVTTKGKSADSKALHGTYRALIANLIKGVAEGWEKELELVGTGYRAELSGKKLVISIGYSHPVEIEAPEGITFEVEKTQIKVKGPDKELVGLISAKIRDIRPPEPYKGKGVMYKDEVVRRKPGKAAKAQGAAA